jgi:[protein]-arginine 3-hydroxylase / protease
MERMPHAIARIEKPSPETVYRDYVRKNRPVIITGVANKWAAISKWTPDYFQASFANLEVSYATWKNSASTDDPDTYLRHRKTLPIKLGAYIELMRSSKDPRDYLINFPIFQRAPHLKTDIEPLDNYMGFRAVYPKAVVRRLKENPRFFLGPAGTISFLHFDGYNNFFVQVYGRKKFFLLSPAQSHLAYYPWRYPHVHYSPVNVEQPDFEKFPLFREAQLLEATVEPGEILFIPVRWWHYARALEESISLNFWWYSMSTILRLWHPLLLYGKSKVWRGIRRRLPNVTTELAQS